MANYFNSFPASFGSKTFTTQTIPGIDYKFGSKLNLSNIDFNKVASLKFNPIAFNPGLNLMGQPGWTFITAPEEVSWSVNNQANRVDMFGTNAPPVVSGSRGMRDLKLGNSLVEGFVRNVAVEGKIAALENLLNYKLNPTDGFVSVPVYQVWANSKSYGGSNAYFIIRDIDIKETMRDITGNATRAYVDISLMEVPEYQVNSGRDQASSTTAGVKSALLSNQAARNANPGAASNAAAKTSVDKGIAGKTAGPTGPTKGKQQKIPGQLPSTPLN